MKNFVVITGGSDGLGKELAELLVADGKRVISLSRSQPSKGVEHIKTDLLDVHSIDKAASELNQDSGKIEALINCAGVLSVEPIDDLNATEIDRVLFTNVRAPMILTSRLMKKLQKDKADIVNVASTVGFKGYQDQAVYGASKWALRGVSANLWEELKDTPCRVISFCPGGFDTKLFKKATGVDNTKQGEWMDPKDLAALLKQLLELPKIMEVSEIVINRKHNNK